MSDVLTPIAFWGWEPPYSTDRPNPRGGSFDESAYITRVHSKTGLAIGQIGWGNAHRIRTIGAHVGEDGIRYGARYLCYQGSTNVLLLPEGQTDIPLCKRCTTGDRPVVYRLFDAHDHLLYVGSTSNCNNRYAYHRWEKTWWPNVARKAEQEFPSLIAARVAERKAIDAERPLHNCPPGRSRKGAAA